MKNLLQTAQPSFDQVETYRIKEESTRMQFQNSALQSIDNNIQSAVNLRVIKDNQLGFAYTRNLRSNEELIANAQKSMLGKVVADYKFPGCLLMETLESYDPDIEQLESGQMAAECLRLSRYIKSFTDADVEIYAAKDINSIELMNSSGTNLTHKTSVYYLYFSLVYPGSASGLSYLVYGKSFKECEHEILDRIIARYQAGNRIVSPDNGAMQVLFMPAAMYALTWRLSLGTSSKSFYEKTTPISEKMGIRIFDHKLTFETDPLNEIFPGCRPFDDEGVVCHRHQLINKGVFEKRYNDLNYAAKLNEKPTGHGFRGSMTSLPAPSLQFMHIHAGHDSFDDMVKGVKKGVILESILGAHSGNLANGDFSIGASPALYIENGKIIGRLKECMVSGNIYKLLRNIDALEDTVHFTGAGMMPALLLDNIRVDT